MQITKRDILILVAFAGVLSLGVTLYVRSQTATLEAARQASEDARSGRDGQPTRTAEADPESTTRVSDDQLASAVAPGTLPADYRAITERKLFAPLVRVQSKAAPRTGVAAVPRVTAPTQKPAKPTSSGSAGQHGGSGNSGQSTPAELPKPPLAVTGLMTWGDGYRVVVENTELKYTRVAKVGDEIFGYRVAEVSEDAKTVTLDRPSFPGGQTVTLKLGENKTVEKKDESAATTGEKKPETPPTSSSSSGGSSSGGSRFGGFDPSRMSPEQRQRWEDWQRRRGSDGGGRGR